MQLIPLSTLKSHLLAPAAAARTDFDTALGLIGLGVAIKFENFCNRKFAYTEDAEITLPANQLVFSVPRFPIIGSVAAVLQPSGGGSTTTITGDISQTDLAAGLVHFESMPGTVHDRVILTYTGGFWIPTGAEGDDQPANSSELPDDLKLAYVEQCRAVAQAQGLFSTAAMPGDTASDNRVISREIKLLPDVVEILMQYRRM